ncbi:MAG: nucleotide exchange factor GrpE [Candidatus Doudnabacteria bacterium]|nr:nucleotide exchange factor GrpE [Candidatus Doudnabacteria bacterium]
MSKDKSQTVVQPENIEMEALKAELERLQKELEQKENDRLLARADLENYRRRTEADKAKYGLISNMQIVMGILEVIDDIQLALQDEGLDKDRAVEMLKIGSDKLNANLQMNGLEKVDVKIGDKFDSATMEAITTVAVDSEDKNNTVVAVVSAGYKYAGQAEMLKTAKVIVGRQKS